MKQRKVSGSPATMPSSTSSAAPTLPPRPTSFKKRKTQCLIKPKVLMIGDSIAHNANFSQIEKQTKSRVRTVKAYSSSCDSKARWPQKNVTDVTPAALVSCHEGDEYSHLVLAAPTVDITNLNTSQVSDLDNIEVYKQQVAVSCQNIFNVAQNALSKHKTLQKVVIMDHPNRHDVSKVDPTGLKPKLAKFANATLSRLWTSSAMKEKIVLGKHNMDSSGESVPAIYRDSWTGRYDGIHMYGRDGSRAYTMSVINIIQSVLPQTSSPSSSSLFSHNTCPQARYQKSQSRNTTSGHRSAGPEYSVPVSNKFDLLGNC